MCPAQLPEVLRLLPPTIHPDLLVGSDTQDDAGGSRVSDTQALVPTVDCFTSIVDDPYAYGETAAASMLSDASATGGRPISGLSIACFGPSSQPVKVWADVLPGAFDKTPDAEAAIMGEHRVEHFQPKFEMAETGIVDPNHMVVKTAAEVGDILSRFKPLGPGIVTTAVTYEGGPEEAYRVAVESVSTLNRAACQAGLAAGVCSATDVPGFGLVRPLYNIARTSGATIEIDARSLRRRRYRPKPQSAALSSGRTG